MGGFERKDFIFWGYEKYLVFGFWFFVVGVGKGFNV